MRLGAYTCSLVKGTKAFKAYGKNTISDITTKISYTTDYMLGVEAGVRTQEIKVDVDSVKSSMKFSGAFVGVYFKF